MTTDTLDCSTNTEIATLPNLGSSERYLRYACAGGTVVTRTASEESDRESYHQALSQLARTLDSKPGVLLASSYEYPGRYRRWDIGFVNPPLMFEGRGRHLHVTALNARGEVLLPEIERAVNACEEVAQLVSEPLRLHLQIKSAKDEGSEEERSRRATVFSVLRAIIAHFKSEEDSFLGLFGAFGYDLTFQFEEIERRQYRGEEDRDLVLYLPDEILVVDHRVEVATTYRYDFLCRKSGAEELTETTGGYARLTVAEPYEAGRDHAPRCDHAPGEFANTVKLAQAHFRWGDLFEAVPGQVFSEVCRDAPSEVFARLQKSNPAPYGALINLCNKEYLVAASPEMFVRVRGRRVETCPISGTIKRGRDALEDAAQIKTLLNSSKDEAELSMCTDVDRNDKARVCVPGSVEVIGRRQIELYSRLIHTVDHVSGTLRADMDALDASNPDTFLLNQSGTFSGNTLTLAAGLATLQAMTPELFAHLDTLGARLQEGLQTTLAKAGKLARVNRCASMVNVWPGSTAPITDMRASDPSSRGGGKYSSWWELVSFGLTIKGYRISSGWMQMSLSEPMNEAIVDGLVHAVEEILVENDPIMTPTTTTTTRAGVPQQIAATTTARVAGRGCAARL